MNQSDINNYNNILSNTKINYSDKLWLGITNITNISNNISNNILDNNINEKLEKELNERKYNFSNNN
jgi:hypothetical protein